ncbi:MAG: ABC transporter ATP-binding protein [Nitrospirae bacterium]|nr:ABC transporter ATP-binding protein [Nitrospirota bacterium]
MVMRMRNVSWRIDGKHILRNISWDVRPAEHWAVIGLNGSGKTSLLNMISGYIWPSTGEVSVLGSRFGECDVRDLRKSIGIVSASLQQRFYSGETSLEIVLSGYDATIGLYDTPGKKKIASALTLLEKMNCSQLTEQTYGTLSQGEKQKILIARALICDPNILILDEPCAGLDFVSREHLLSTIEHLATKSFVPSILYVSHHIEEIIPSFSHLLLLRKGEIYAAGKRESLITTETLSDFFEMPVNVHKTKGRIWLSVNR